MINGTLQSTNGTHPHWQAERLSIEDNVRSIRAWAKDAASLATPPMGQLGEKLCELADLCRSHFRREAQIYDQLQEELGCIEVEAAKRQAEADHRHLLERFDLLSNQLAGSRTPFANFEEACERAEWLFDDLDQHEEREAESIQWLSKNGCA